MTRSDRSELSDAAVAVLAASAGATVARALYGTEVTRVDKDGVDFATAADIEAERAIRAVLAEHRPDDAIVGEELGVRGRSSRRWLVDPICGTLNFAAGVPLFAVTVALDDDGVTTAAAVADPAAGEVFWSDGGGAWRAGAGGGDGGSGGGIDVRLAPSASSRLVTVNLETRDPRGLVVGMLSNEVLFTRFSPRCFSSTLALAWVAAGKQAAYVTGGALRGSVHWEAGIALCRAAGAVVTNLDGGDLHTGGQGLIAAADAETHEFVLTALHSRSS